MFVLQELNLGRNRLKALQHELACSRAVLKAKPSELEEEKKAMKRNRHLQEKSANETAQHLFSGRAPQIKGGDVVNPDPASDASHAASIKKPGNATRKRMLRSRSLGPAASMKLAVSKEKESVQRRKSTRTPQPSDHRQDLFEMKRTFSSRLAVASPRVCLSKRQLSSRADRRLEGLSGRLRKESPPTRRCLSTLSSGGPREWKLRCLMQ